jgi:hypothetical protein
LVIPAGILRIPVFSVPVALFSQESQFLFCRNYFRNVAGIPVVYIRPHTTGIPATSPKTHSCEKFLWKTQEKKEILRNPGRNVFFCPKNKFLKTGITNLDWSC